MIFAIFDLSPVDTVCKTQLFFALSGVKYMAVFQGYYIIDVYMFYTNTLLTLTLTTSCISDILKNQSSLISSSLTISCKQYNWSHSLSM